MYSFGKGGSFLCYCSENDCNDEPFNDFGLIRVKGGYKGDIAPEEPEPEYRTNAEIIEPMKEPPTANANDSEDD